MRITSGTLRGRKLRAPEGSRVRPTSDKVRQAIFNILSHNDFGIGFSLQGAHVADLFAGSGALGMEALSHGAAFCLFIDDSAESRALIRENAETLGLTGVIKIWRRNAAHLGPLAPGAGGPFNLVFLDPPYRKALLGPVLSALRDGWLAARALVVAESGVDETLGVTGYRWLDERRYGQTRVTFLTPAE